MGLVGGGKNEYDADYVFATVQTLNKDSHLLKHLDLKYMEEKSIEVGMDMLTDVANQLH